MLRRIASRVPLGFAFFLGCVVLSTLFEVARFPERRSWMVGFALGFAVLVAVAWAVIHYRPTATVAVLVAFVNVVGVALNVYHAVVGAPVAMCLWTLTGLIGSTAVMFPWGARTQAIASLGAVVSYPLHLIMGGPDPLTWAAGGTYLLVAVGLATFGASLSTRYVMTGLRLSAALSEREARLQSYFDLSLVGTVILSRESRCDDVNDELCRMLGHTRADLLGKAWVALVHPDERNLASEMVARVLRGAGAERHELRCLRRDRGIVDTVVSARGLPGPDGTVDHVIVVIQDMTEHRRAEAERDRAKDTFLAMVSHDLRTPLSSILAWSGMLRGGKLDGTQREAAVDAIERNALAQARLIGDLLDVSRIVSSDWELTLSPIDLVVAVRAAVDVVAPSANAKGVMIDVALPAEPVCIEGDVERLQQVVWNLLANAVKFTAPGARVQLRLESGDGLARLSVADEGEGIAPDLLPHVFERFRQGESASVRKHGGLGLGLAIVRALVDRHGGTVRAESRGPGAGSTFTVELPLHAGGTVQTRLRADRPATPGATALRGRRILVVDDDPDSNATVSALLTSCGADVRTALSSADAIEIATRWQPHVLVSDLVMPGDDGCTLLRALRTRDDDLAHLPAIALTAQTGAVSEQRAFAAGFEAYVAKPFDAGELTAAIATAAGVEHAS